MKIISYNIHHCTQEKVDNIIRRGADVCILPEMSDPATMAIPAGFNAFWTGDISWKGLGVIVRPGIQARVPDWFNPSSKYFIPLIVKGMLIIAAWPTRRESNEPKGYPQIALEGIREYAVHFDAFPTLISGDLNLYMGQQDETEEYSLLSFASLLRRYGMVSAYHHFTHELFGEESVATYYHRFDESQPFFLDYTFTNIPVKRYRLVKWNAGFSDHVAQVIDI